MRFEDATKEIIIDSGTETYWIGADRVSYYWIHKEDFEKRIKFVIGIPITIAVVTNENIIRDTMEPVNEILNKLMIHLIVRIFPCLVLV